MTAALTSLRYRYTGSIRCGRYRVIAV